MVSAYVYFFPQKLQWLTCFPASSGNTNLQAHAIPYDVLFAAARDKFIATNDTALRALLHEFRDHGLVVGAGSPEALWIPMRKERLASVLKTLPEEK